MIKLSDIINCPYNIYIKDVKTDSRKVEKNDLFIAVKGYNVDHNNFINDAIRNGAVAIITENNAKIDTSIPIIKVNDINKSLVDICKKIYNYNENLDLIAVTGTDGKTTTSTIIKEVLSNYKKTAYIGTNGIEYLDKSISTNNTTPIIEELYKYIEMLNKSGIETISMEVSSEALIHKRIDGLKFKYAVFTNITEDHLNVHKSINKYIKDKLNLVNYLRDNGKAIVNLDDKNLKSNINIIKSKIITYGKSHDCDFIISNIKYIGDKTSFEILHNGKIYPIKTSLIGEYNIYNLTAAFIVCYLEQKNIVKITNSIKKINLIKGRGEKIDFGQAYDVVLDYAHTLNGIKSIVSAYKNKYKRIIVVTGAAGGREVQKRSKIGKFLLENVDLVVFTMDDPRYEYVENIINDMLKETSKRNYIRIISRSSAVKYALSIARSEDVVLILGKGRDNYMAVENRKIYYSDYDEIKNYLLNNY